MIEINLKIQQKNFMDNKDKNKLLKMVSFRSVFQEKNNHKAQETIEN